MNLFKFIFNILIKLPVKSLILWPIKFLHILLTTGKLPIVLSLKSFLTYFSTLLKHFTTKIILLDLLIKNFLKKDPNLALLFITIAGYIKEKSKNWLKYLLIALQLYTFTALISAVFEINGLSINGFLSFINRIQNNIDSYSFDSLEWIINKIKSYYNSLINIFKNIYGVISDEVHSPIEDTHNPKVEWISDPVKNYKSSIPEFNTDNSLETNDSVKSNYFNYLLVGLSCVGIALIWYMYFKNPSSTPSPDSVDPAIPSTSNESSTSIQNSFNTIKESLFHTGTSISNSIRDFFYNLMGNNTNQGSTASTIDTSNVASTSSSQETSSVSTSAHSTPKANQSPLPSDLSPSSPITSQAVTGALNKLALETKELFLKDKETVKNMLIHFQEQLKLPGISVAEQIEKTNQIDAIVEEFKKKWGDYIKTNVSVNPPAFLEKVRIVKSNIPDIFSIGSSISI